MNRQCNLQPFLDLGTGPVLTFKFIVLLVSRCEPTSRYIYQFHYQFYRVDLRPYSSMTRWKFYFDGVPIRDWSSQSSAPATIPKKSREHCSMCQSVNSSGGRLEGYFDNPHPGVLMLLIYHGPNTVSTSQYLSNHEECARDLPVRDSACARFSTAEFIH